MSALKCQSCGAMNDDKRYFCSHCGRFLLSTYEGVSEAATESERKLQRIASNLKTHPHMDVLWNDTVDAYTRKVERIQSLLRLRDMGIQSAELTEKVDRFLEICRKPDFEIAFVGAVKAGKSTLINALLGKNYASTDPNPETAVLTKFRSSPRDYINITFYTKEEWVDLWSSVQQDADRFLELYRSLEADKHKNRWIGHDDLHMVLEPNQMEAELKKWSSSQSAVHFFVKEIEVGISTLPKEFPQQIVFVDTPGLFDPVAYRSQISVDYIHKANAVMVCVKAEDLHGEEVKTLESVFSFSGHKREKVFVIATNWDKLNNVVTTWQKRYEYMIDSFTGKAFFPDRRLAQSNIIYVDSHHYNLCRDFQFIKRSEKREIVNLVFKFQSALDYCYEENKPLPDSMKAMNRLANTDITILTPADLRAIMDVTNVDRIRQLIVREFVNQYTELLYKDIEVMYGEILHMVQRVAGERKKAMEERISISHSDLEEIEQKLAEAKNNREELRKVQERLVAALNTINKSTQQRLATIRSQLEEISRRPEE